jgi:hypothetical protein
MLCEKPPSDNLAGFAPTKPLEDLKMSLLDISLYARDLHDQVTAGSAIPENTVLGAVDVTDQVGEVMVHLRRWLMEGQR